MKQQGTHESTQDRWLNEETGEIELRPKAVYYFSKHFFLIIFLIITIYLCTLVSDRYAKLALSTVCLGVMLYLLLRYISIMLYTKWTVTDKSIVINKGILVKTTNETALFRVIDFSEKQNVLQSIFNNTDLYVYSSDKTDPTLCIFGITKNKDAFEEIKKRVKAQREINHIKETNINYQTL